MTAFTYTDELQVLECGGCHVNFAIPTRMYEKRKKDHKSFYCPNGCGRCFIGQSDQEKLQDSLSREEERRKRAELELQATEKSRQTYKGHLTRVKNRIGKGVCPCCNRHFKNVESHMQNKHPEFSE